MTPSDSRGAHSLRKMPDLDLPAGCPLCVVGPAGDLPAKSRAELGRELNRDGWDPGQPTLFVVNDAQRATPTALVLSLFDPPVDTWPHAAFLVATGSHGPPEDGELEAIFGRRLLASLGGRVVIHRALAPEMACVGKTGRGTNVMVNPLLLQAKSLITIGSVEPHYFAGYTGGRKSIVPGLAAFETIRENHRLAMEPSARPLVLEDNPLHLDLEEACRLVLRRARRRGLRRETAVTLVHRGARVFHLETGSIEGAVDRARPWADAVHTTEVPRRFAVVVAVPEAPLDRDFYQAMKSFEHGRRVLTPGGVVILAAECARGIGPAHFAGLLADSQRRGFRPSLACHEYELSAHKVANLARHREGGNRLFLVSKNGPAELDALNALGIERFRSLDTALAGALSLTKGLGEEPGVLLIRDAAVVVPRIGRVFPEGSAGKAAAD